MHRPPPHPLDEDERIAALKRYRILDTAPEPQFDRVAAIARRQFEVPLALVTFMDSDRNFLKSRGDLPISETPRDVSFCGHTILSDEVLVVPDATLDERFAENPFVNGEFHIRFYAGAPLITPEGRRIGTVCVFDTKPRPDFDREDAAKLRDLADIVSDHLEMRMIVGNVHDEIETRRTAEAEARYIALHDPLTGLPNRAYLQKVMAEGLPFKIRGTLAALSSDLDQFKAVNDAFGHLVGDDMLKRVAELIRTELPDDAFIARASGDEFVMLFDAESREFAASAAAGLAARAGNPISQSNHLLRCRMSIGVGFAEAGDPTPEEAMKRAESALYRAKRTGQGGVVVFDAEMERQEKRRLRLIQDLPFAIERNEIAVHYQPIHRASDRAMIGAEALLRWTHAVLGPIGPDEFIPLAEESGQIVALGRYVMRRALRDARAWDDLFVSVNLSPVEFRLSDLPQQVPDILSEIGFPADRVRLEVTEGVLLHDVEAARRQIDALKALGVRIALDDFGTGYSSLSYLRSLPFDKVKIDRSFVHGIGEDTTNHAIVRLIVALARELRMKVTAEGVESESEVGLLRALGVDSFQGYYFGRPMPAAELTARLSAVVPVARLAAG